MPDLHYIPLGNDDAGVDDDGNDNIDPLLLQDETSITQPPPPFPVLKIVLPAPAHQEKPKYLIRYNYTPIFAL
jgi:hypothetical protein